MYHIVDTRADALRDRDEIGECFWRLQLGGATHRHADELVGEHVTHLEDAEAVRGKSAVDEENTIIIIKFGKVPFLPMSSEKSCVQKLNRY